ncbi:acetylornithine deacetylase [Jiangella endophytica]|uniref:acetylornithine deacetylase n=1 Tax=Jiangella endophytica TaxID=1623398 RepID=UPI0018E56A73|nr:acetylornithine deacetylase [Jiangella endophytica]
MSELPRSIEWMERLIGFDTVSRHSNLPLIHEVADRLDTAGFVTAVRPDVTGDKANLVATLPAADGSMDGGLVLSGHTDVVPTEGQEWTSDPFAATVRDGRIYGRGTSDMKSFLAVALAAVPTMLEAPLREPVHFALTYDEEVGLFGGAQIVGDLRDLGLTPARCIVGEPTGMAVVAAHKSITLARIVVRGLPGHSSMAPHLVSAAFHGAQVITFVQELAEEFEREGPFDGGYTVPFSTISVDYLNGGSFSTTVPGECEIRFDLRTIDGVESDDVVARIRERAGQVEAAMRERHPSTGIDVTVLAQAPGLTATTDSALVDVLTAAGAEAPGVKVAFGTEAGFFSSVGIDTVVCGPGHIEQAHIADEYVSIEQIRTCERVLDGVIATMRDA